jgi:hypothetical protein
MAKRTRDDRIIRHKKRPLEDGDKDTNEHKKRKEVEYWHHGLLTRQERAASMAAMYIYLLNIKKN